MFRNQGNDRSAKQIIDWIAALLATVACRILQTHNSNVETADASRPVEQN
jgi:hypothetical protein